MLSHHELEITFAELGALLGTREMMKQQLLIGTCSSEVLPKEHLFNMNISLLFAECGTVACIGGHMALIMDVADKEIKYANKASINETAWRYVGEKASRALLKLFYPHPLTSWEFITRECAIEAIDNFLNTGNPQWARAAYNHDLFHLIPRRTVEALNGDPHYVAYLPENM